MMYIKNIDNLEKVINGINKYADFIGKTSINIMEVCGTHTNNIAKYGIKSVISKKINLLSGPGCPVCVTNIDYIDAAIELVSQGVTIITFGDLIKVTGSNSSLAIEKSKGRDIRIIYSINEIIRIAKDLYPKEVVFLAVGFETTAPSIALSIKEAYRGKINNLSFLTSIKIMPPILHKILRSKDKEIHGMICPGNVSVITGADSFKFIYEDYNISAVICGFEAEEILSSIFFLTKDIYKKITDKNQIGFKNLYRKWASSKGNKIAQNLIKDVFILEDVVWRGIGKVENSSLVIKDTYTCMDTIKKFNLQGYFNKDKSMVRVGEKNQDIDKGCSCKDVLLGNIYPFQCRLFRGICTPENPFGPCMVSEEGACFIYYKYYFK